MGFQDAVTSCFEKYATFQGRASRSEYWFFFLFFILVVFALYTLRYAWAFGSDVLMWLFFAAFILPHLAVAVRRLHDMNAAGWWYLLVLVPYVGGLIVTVWFCFKGTHGDNRFGPDPLVSMPDRFS